MSFNESKPFTDEYKELCFQKWLLSGCPPVSRTLEILPASADGRKPSTATLSAWMMDNDWKMRAKDINEQALATIHDDLVKTKAELFRNQFKTAIALAEKAANQLLSEKIDNSNAAVQLWHKANIEARTVMGISEFMEKFGRMTDEELQKAIAEGLERWNIVDPIPLDEEANIRENKPQDKDDMTSADS